MAWRIGLAALLASLYVGCVGTSDNSDNRWMIISGMSVSEVKTRIIAAKGQYLEFAYHYPGEGEYLRFFELSTGQIVVATVRGDCKGLADTDQVANFMLPPKSFTYSKRDFVGVLENR